MKHLALLMFAGAMLLGNSGCCCLSHRMHMFGRSLHCNDCGGQCGGQCGVQHAEPAGCGCGDAGCGGDCGHGGAGYDHGGGAGCTSGCSGGCGGSCGGNCGGRDGGWGGFNWGWGSSGCSILGCSSHYLDPKGACYGAYCGNCCEKGGCGPRYWGDWFNVPRTTEPCDCCANFVGPSHSYHGSTPWYYGPPPQYANPGYGSPSLHAGHHDGEHIVSEEIVGQPTTTTTRTVAKPTNAGSTKSGSKTMR